MVALNSKTDDDGTPHVLEAHLEHGRLAVMGDNEPAEADPAIIPASLWNMAIVKRGNSVVLNTLDGSKMAIDVAFKGEEQVAGESGPVTARHYVIGGDLQRELWYDPDGILVKFRFKGSDGSDIQYVLR